MNVIMDAMPALVAGLKITFYITLASLIIAFFIGLFIAILRLSPIKFLRWISIAYIDLIRGTPILVQIFFIYFGLPVALGTQISPLLAGITAISINAGAYSAEIIRAGIQAVDKGQTEAARSLGMTGFQTMRMIILPQALRKMLPTFVNQAIISLKDTSLLSIIGIRELTQSGQIIVANNFQGFKIWGAVGIMYFILIYLLTFLSRMIERRYQLR